MDPLQKQGAQGRTARVRTLTPEEKNAILSMTSYKEMAPAERKRQLSALDRRMQDTASLPPGLLQQYQAAYGSSDKKFELLRPVCTMEDINDSTVCCQSSGLCFRSSLNGVADGAGLVFVGYCSTVFWGPPSVPFASL